MARKVNHRWAQSSRERRSLSYAQAGRNIEDALGRAGATLSDIVSVRQWLTNAADIPAYAAVRSSIITHQPVFMLALVWPNIWVEIKVTAIRPALTVP
jgi:2-iminobutanoate/2-iminopropanoate deaminase